MNCTARVEHLGLRGHGGERAAECDRAAPAVCLAHKRDSVVEFCLHVGVAFSKRVELVDLDLQPNGGESHSREDSPPVLLEVAAHVGVAACAALRPSVRLLCCCGEHDGECDGDAHGDAHAVCLLLLLLLCLAV